MGSMKDLLGDTPFESRYPNAPGFTDSGASRDAAFLIGGGSSKALQEKCLAALLLGPLTADEVATKIARSPFAVRPRLTELKKLGKVEKLKERRRNESGLSASIWRLA